MRYLWLADIHANLEALTAVLDDAHLHGDIDEMWCLGDIVGYGPNPNECIEVISRYGALCVAGNHDLAAIGKLSTSFFNPEAALAIGWTAATLKAEHRSYLLALPLGLEREEFTLVHGSPREPALEYIISVGSAREAVSYLKTRFAVVGHTHLPLIFREQEGGGVACVSATPEVVQVVGEHRAIFNPGAAGQPRDGDPRASYAIYDSEAQTVRFFRVPYDVSTTQLKMVRCNLPLSLVTRLEQGR